MESNIDILGGKAVVNQLAGCGTLSWATDTGANHLSGRPESTGHLGPADAKWISRFRKQAPDRPEMQAFARD